MTGKSRESDFMVVYLLAAAGYGKTTALRHRFPDPEIRWLSGLPDFDDVHGAIIDDLPLLTVDQATRLLEANPIAIASRHPLPVSTARLRGRGLLTELGPADLALTEDETTELLAAEYGVRDPDLADQLHAATAGWPALVRLGALALAASGTLLPEPGSPLWSYIAEEVLDAAILPLLADIAGLNPITDGLMTALGHSGVGFLRDTGLLVNSRVVPAIARVVGDERTASLCRQPALPASCRPGAVGRRSAAAWYEEHGPAVAAVQAHAREGNLVQCGRILDAHGQTILAAGHADVITEVIEQIPMPGRSRSHQLLLGDALRTSGSVLSAAQAYAVVADREPGWDAGLAWRMGLIHYLRGDGHAALKAFARAEEDDEPSADLALLLSWRACAHLQLGETATAAETAELACRTATTSGDDMALATAYVSLALCQSISGETTGSAELYLQAHTLAERAGNVVLRARILTSQTYQLLCDAKYADALATARQTAQCAATAGHTNLRSIALCNEGDALLMLGRYDEALRQYERAHALCRRMGSRRSAAAHLGQGEVYRRRGWTEQARAAYETASALAEESGLNQVRVCALAGLARVLMTDDLAIAEHTAEQAGRLASDRVVAPALVARGWVALQGSDAPAAAEFASDAAKVARAERDPAGIAEALELKAAAAGDLKRARAALREAQAIWAGAGAVVDAARILAKLGSLPGADTDDRLGALDAMETLVRAGVPGAGGRHQENPVVVRAFGRFEVCLNDEVIPPAQWQSRKARELLRILVARRGRPVPRGELCELLWPDNDSAKTGHRLSVLLSIVKGVLDPEKALAADHYLVADQASIGLDVTRLRVDVEDFLADVGHGRRLRERGSAAAAHQLLAVAVQGYRADVFEDEPYSEWSTALREEARAAYVSALRMLAQTGRKLGKTSAAISYLMRLLSIDPYDEAGHRALIETLVAGGQHGEARRASTRYREAMRAIGIKVQ